MGARERLSKNCFCKGGLGNHTRVRLFKGLLTKVTNAKETVTLRRYSWQTRRDQPTESWDPGFGFVLRKTWNPTAYTPLRG